jgi:hypothetical protein
MFYSKQKIFCNICGKEFHIEYDKIIGRECKVCSMACLKEYELRRAKSIMG